MKVIGLAGWSCSGKTSLMVRLIPALTARGLRVSTVKHAHHRFDVDRPGKDSYEHRLAGAQEVMISSRNRWALMHETRDAPEPSLDELLARLSPVDIVLVEGFKRAAIDKIEVFRRAVGMPLLCVDDGNVVAVASDGPVPDAAVPVLALDDADAIADFVVARSGLGAARRHGAA